MKVYKSYLCALVCWSLHATDFSLPDSYKIAVVKQVTYQDLYCAPSTASKKDIVFSTFKRTGPVGLFSYFNADFYIVDVAPEPECAVWKERATHCRQFTIAFYESLKTSIPYWGVTAGHTVPQGTFAISCNDIPWKNYDIVICFDIPVPTSIIQSNPHILWCYYVGEPCQPAFQQSKNKPIAGYDCFLSQDFHATPHLKDHSIEFPYCLQYYGCFHDLLQLNPATTNKSGASSYGSFTKDQEKVLSSMLHFTKHEDRVSAKTLIANLLSSKYYIFCTAMQGRGFYRGNALPEAVATGNLLLGNPHMFENKSLFTPKTSVHSFKELVERIGYFEKNPRAYTQALQEQRRLLNYYCFTRPMQDLFFRLKKKRAAYR